MISINDEASSNSFTVANDRRLLSESFCCITLYASLDLSLPVSPKPDNTVLSEANDEERDHLPCKQASVNVVGHLCGTRTNP